MQAIIYDLEEFNAKLSSEFDTLENNIEYLDFGVDVFSTPRNIRDEDFLNALSKLYKNRVCLKEEEKSFIINLSIKYI
ncbi:MAG: hypothetical protein M0Q14_11140 [Tissierellaceae bacterium]|jgi:hypothetical protein|nr:hypothetical protein [Tissierellaceae bacterium]